MNQTLIPNSFQHPNVYIDRLAFYLTPEEEKVLNKAVREILGWNDRIAERKAPIALSVFVDGKVNRETGERLAYGCGLSLAAVRKALKALNRYHILEKMGEPTPDGQCYWLQDDIAAIDWAGLEVRHAEREQRNTRRTHKATNSRKGVTSDDTPNVGRKGITSDDRGGITSDDRGGITSDDREGVTSDDRKETQIETHPETQTGNPDPPTDVGGHVANATALPLPGFKAPHSGAPKPVPRVKAPETLDAAQIFQHLVGWRPKPGLRQQIKAVVGTDTRHKRIWWTFIQWALGENWNSKNTNNYLEVFQQIITYPEAEAQAALEHWLAVRGDGDGRAYTPPEAYANAATGNAGAPSPEQDPGPPESALWEKTKAAAELQMARATYQAHIKPTHCRGPNGAADTWIVAAPAHSVDWLDTRLRVLLERTASQVAGRDIHLQFVAQPAPPG